MTACFTLLVGGCINANEVTKVKTIDTYNIKMISENKRLVQIDATFNIVDSFLFMSGNGPVAERWVDYVRDLTVKTNKGVNVRVKKTKDHKWLIYAKAGEQVTINYQIILKHDEIEWPGGLDGVAFVNEWGVFYSGRSLFIMNGKDRENIHVNFYIPDAWDVATPWLQKGSKEHSFVANNYFDLTESLVFAGTFEKFSLNEKDLNILFVLGGDSIVKKKEQYAKIATQIMKFYISTMGGLPKSSKNIPFSKMLVLINESDNTDGEVIGSHINLLVKSNGGMQDQLIGWFLFAHEFFHLWSGKTIVNETTKEEWFKEGVTNYYVMKALYNIDVVNEEGMTMVMNNLFYKRYSNDPELGKMSIQEAGSTFNKDKHWGLVYGGGMFAGISLDMMIRNQTKNVKSLDNLMQSFYQIYGGTEKTYTTNDLLEKVNELGGMDLTSFFEKYIIGADEIKIEEYLQYAGFDIEKKDGNLIFKKKKNMSEFQKALMQGFYGK